LLFCRDHGSPPAILFTHRIFSLLICILRRRSFLAKGSVKIAVWFSYGMLVVRVRFPNSGAVNYSRQIRALIRRHPGYRPLIRWKLANSGAL
jgi:hypothetical protein